jgi:amidase
LISIKEQLSLLLSGDLRPTELLAKTWEVIDRHNPTLGAFTALWQADAMARAEALEKDTTPQGPLWGVPSADKDLVNRAGYATGWGSRATANWPVPHHSDPMATWLDTAGAISVGKTATSEFGLTGYTEPVAFPPTRNPHHLDHGVGGSSGGAACAVASGMLSFAPGSDGGGSVRIPALACGVVGLKPSRGRVPAGSGLDSASGLVVPGILARTVDDVSYVSDALFSGPYHWSTAAPALSRSLSEAARDDSAPLRIAVTTTTPWASDVDCPLDAEAEVALERAVAALEDAGHSVHPWEWAPLPGYFEAFSVMWQSSAAGMALSDEERDLVEPLTAYLVDRGRQVTGSQLMAAVSWLRQFEQHTISAMAGWDAVLTPGLAMTPPELGWYSTDDPEKNFLQQIQVTPYTSFVNVCGLPALVLPTNYTASGLPMGVQLVGGPGREDTVVGLGAAIEKRVDALRWPVGYGPV